MRTFLLAAVCFALGGLRLAAQDFDVVICGGRAIDGTGRAPVNSDIVIFDADQVSDPSPFA